MLFITCWSEAQRSWAPWPGVRKCFRKTGRASEKLWEKEETPRDMKFAHREMSDNFQKLKTSWILFPMILGARQCFPTSAPWKELGSEIRINIIMQMQWLVFSSIELLIPFPMAGTQLDLPGSRAVFPFPWKDLRGLFRSSQQNVKWPDSLSYNSFT